MAVIEFRTLGTLDLRRADGSELHSLLAQPKRIALLAYLCLAKPRGFHRRDTLLGLFWPDADQTHARTSLRNALHVLRHSLGETALHSRGDEEIVVNFDAVWCDAVAFEEQTASEEIDGALELYRGDFLSGFFLDDVPAFERWLDGERIGLRATAARAVRVAAERRELEGNLTGAISLARRSVELTDTDERAVRRLVELLARVGDRAGALQAYENFERHLATEFDAEPSAETRALIDGLRGQQGAGTSARGSRTDAPVEVQSTPGIAPGYSIEGELGRGGTSTVFRAHDLKHDRSVAIKFLRPEVAAVLGTDRFLAEITLAARLHHPHILPLLDSGMADGLPYYVMPNVEGETLRSRLRREKFLPIEDAIRIASEVADALGYAHSRGFIHRDIKPENILLENGHALVTDFGIALALGNAGGQRLTQTGLAVGTAAYMSPEQADSTIEIDARTDIYALGCVLYEMLAGDPPFTGSTAQTVLARKAVEPAPSMRTVRETISPNLERNVLKALSRAPADRFRNVKEFAEALTSQRGDFADSRTTTPLVSSLVVLPFANLSGDPQQEYFVDGMHEAIIDELTKIVALKVISRTSAMHYKKSQKTLPEIGRELRVDAVAEGSIAREHGRVRIVVHLVDARTERSLWARSFERDVQNVLALQSEIAQAVAEGIHVTVSPADRERFEATGQPPAGKRPNPEAYDAYLKGRFYFAQGGPSSERAIGYYEEAIAKDSSFANAYASLAEVSLIGADTRERAQIAAAVAEKAVVLDPSLPEAHSALAIAHMLDWNWRDSEAEFKRAIALNPNSAVAHQWYAQLLRQTLRLDEALTEAKRAEELDPLSLMVKTMVGWVLFNERRYDEAIAVWNAVLDLEPEFGLAAYNLGLAYWMKGQGQQVILAAQRSAAARLNLDDLHASWLLAAGHALSGQHRAAKGILNQFEARYSTRASAFIAAIYHLLGDNEEALNWLEKAYRARDPWLPNITSEPQFDSLREHPRFCSLRDRMGLQ